MRVLRNMIAHAFRIGRLLLGRGAPFPGVYKSYDVFVVCATAVHALAAIVLPHSYTHTRLGHARGMASGFIAERIRRGLHQENSMSSSSTHDTSSEIVRLNVGGRMFATARATLGKDPSSILARIVQYGSNGGGLFLQDDTGAVFIVRA